VGKRDTNIVLQGREAQDWGFSMQKVRKNPYFVMDVNTESYQSQG